MVLKASRAPARAADGATEEPALAHLGGRTRTVWARRSGTGRWR